MDTNYGVTAGRQDFDVLAMLALMKDQFRPNEYAAVLSQVQCGNADVIQAIQCSDKAAAMAAAGIARELCEVGRDLAKGLSDTRYDIAREIAESSRDTIHAFVTGVDKITDKVDYVKAEVCDVKLELLKSSYESQLRDKDNMFAVLAAIRDSKDTTKDEIRIFKEIYKEDKEQDLRDKLVILHDKYSDVKSERKFRDIVREYADNKCHTHHEHHGHRGFGYGDGYGYFDDCDDDFRGHGHGRGRGRGRGGWKGSGRDGVDIEQRFFFDSDGHRRGRGHGRGGEGGSDDDDGHGNPH